MATREVKVCDVCGSMKGVDDVLVAVSRTGNPVKSVSRDMCQRCCDKAVQAMERATTPKGERKGKSDAPTDTTDSPATA